VVVPVRNAAATIDACVTSLLALRYPSDRLEVIVVDNGSRDATASRLARYDGRVRVVDERRRGAGAARNAGVARAEGDVVAFTDADCVVDPEWLAHLVRPLADPRVGIAGGTILATLPANRVERFGEEIHDHRRALEGQRPPYAITMSWASRREVLRDLGGFDERFLRCQDIDLSYRAVRAGYELAYVAEAVVRHRNEATLRGLFAEGFVHGLHGVRARRRHAGLLREHGHSGPGRPRLADVGGHLRALALGPDRVRAGCLAAFDSGKLAGRTLGSWRWARAEP
jgi:cellulose synthase/poly-beta-1,6-N-acetylglucosamine synthase-like glycosyltransferase